MNSLKRLNILLFIISLSIFALPYKSQSQSDSAGIDTSFSVVDSNMTDSSSVGDSLALVKKKFLFPVYSVSFGMEIGKTLLQTTFLKDQSYQAFYGDLQYKKYFFAFEFGRQSYSVNGDYSIQQYNYSGSGGFFRIGIDQNILKKKGGLVLTGLRYGNAYTKMDGSFKLEDDQWGTYNQVIDETVKSHWIEAHLGMRANFPLGLQIGISVRMAQIIANTRDRTMIPLRIPGYGKGSLKNSFSLEYFVVYRIRFRKYTPPPKKK